jgi:tRNA nucleotidyltransferase (CCA-adding enzyme)
VEGHPVLSKLARRSDPSAPIHLSGGAVRDVLIGAEVLDIDLVVGAGAGDLARELAPDALVHERFGTAELEVEGHRVDIATARSETYAAPGALPEVTLGVPAERDLLRRDFTINAMAVPLHDPEALIDPAGGRPDLEEGLLRVLHPRSFGDDPTRGLRAARYAARFGFGLAAETAALLPEVDLAMVSAERVAREKHLIATEPAGIEAFRLAAEWGLLDIPAGRLELADRAVHLLGTDTWRGRATRSEVVLGAIENDFHPLPHERPETPYSGLLLAHGLRLSEVVLNRAAGAAWLDDYVNEWSQVRLAITGDDLILAGIPQGPAIGAGMAAALKAKLDEGVSGIEAELAVAVRAAEAAIAGD